MLAAVLAFLIYAWRQERYTRIRFEQTVGEFTGKRNWLTSSTLKVHLLRGEDREQLISIELVEKGIGGCAWMPMTLSVSQVQQLVSLLQRATSVEPGIEQTIGVITGDQQLTVYRPRPENGENLIGIDLHGCSSDGDSMSPIALTVTQAQHLALLLESATRTHQAT